MALDRQGLVCCVEGVLWMLLVALRGCSCNTCWVSSRSILGIIWVYLDLMLFPALLFSYLPYYELIPFRACHRGMSKL